MAMDWKRGLESGIADVRYALRGLRREPGYAITAVLTLALGLGAVTAMFAVVDSVLLRPVPLAHAGRLAVPVNRQDGKPEGFFSFAQLDAIAKGSPGIEDMARVVTMPKVVSVAGDARMTEQAEITPNLFSIVGAKPELGRVFTKADGSAVAVVSDDFWRERMHADPHALGTTITANGRLVQVVGVLPHGFAYPRSYAPVVYEPMTLNAKGQTEQGFDGSDALILLRPGVSLNVARQQVTAAFAQQFPRSARQGQTAGLTSYRETVVGTEQPALLALLGAYLLLLAIACANVANLQIVRSARRATEISLRAALGAGRGRILQQVLVESVSLALLGGVLGLALAAAAVHWMRVAYGGQFARFEDLRLQPWVFAVCLGLALAAGALAAMAPALTALRSARAPRPMESSRTLARSRSSSLLVAVELALTCVLLITAGLFIQTFRALEQAPLGFDPHGVTNVVLMSENPALNGTAYKQTYEKLVQDFGSMPGVQGATTQTTLPFSNFQFTLTTSFRMPGRVLPPKAQVGISMITAGYSRVMRMPIVRGRGLSPEDREGMPVEGLVNEAFVRHFLHGQDPLGQQISLTNEDPTDKSPPFLTQPVTVVGVAQDEVDGAAIASVQPTLFIDYRQFPAASEMASMLFGLAPQFAVRSALSQAVLDREIRGELRRDAPEMAEMGITPVEQAITKSLSQRLLALRLASAFGLLALTLAAVGIYGVLAYAVAQRRREIGIRMALGSSRAGAVSLVARQAARMVAAGVLVGFAVAWPVGRVVKAFLYGVQPMDAWALAATACVLLLVCAVAAAVPAWRAAQVDPMEALRAE